MELYSLFPQNFKQKDNIFYKIWRGFQLFLFFFSGLDFRHFIKILHKTYANKYDLVFIDYSTLGILVPFIRLISKDSKIMVQFHNCEYEYYNSTLKLLNFLKKLILLIVYVNEKLALKADCALVLTERDQKAIKALYKKELNLILPITLEDNFSILPTTRLISDDYIYYPCSTISPNVEGAKWFIEEVLPHINLKLVISGKGIKEIITESSPNLIVYDYIEDIAPLIQNATAIINPVFTGSGMKTKTIEGLMHGKHLIGTNEAFTGIDIQKLNVNLCNTKKEFIQALSDKNKIKVYNQNNRDYYLSNFSQEKRIEFFEKLL